MVHINNPRIVITGQNQLNWKIERILITIIILLTASLTVFSQTRQAYISTQNNVSRTSWEQTVRQEFKAVPNPQSRSTMRITPERQDTRYWTSVLDNGKKCETVVVYFRNAISRLEDNYAGNYKMLEILDRTFSDDATLTLDQMDYVTITSAALPDGYTATNEKLVTERALEIKNYIAHNHPQVNRDRIVTFSAGEVWGGLRRMIEEDFRTPKREKALRILASPLSGEDMRKRLQLLDAGRTYRYLSNNMFPNLRDGVACMIYFKKDNRGQASASDSRYYQMPSRDNRGQVSASDNL